MTEYGERKARATVPVPVFPKERETPAEHVRHAIMYLMNPHYESHGARIFTVEQVGDINRLLWRAVNILEGRADP
jgi:hypothetical protein